MKFSNYSSNFNSESGILQLMEDLGYAAISKEEIFMLGGGNPASIPEMEYVFRNEMETILSHGREFENLVGYYDSPQGNHGFLKALTNLLREQFNWSITEENLAVTNGSQSSFGILFNLFSGTFADGFKKHIKLPMTPEYIGYNDAGITSDSIFQSSKPLIQDAADEEYNYFKYSVDFESIKLNETCGALCVSRPTNPTGNVVTDSELAQLSSMAKGQEIPLIIDGAYGLPFPGMIFTEATPIWDQHIILCLSLSKLGLPGVRTGIVVAEPSIINIIKASNAIQNLSPSSFGPMLVTRLLENKTLLNLCDKHIKPYYLNKQKFAINQISESMNGIPVRIHKPEGAMFLWLWFQNLPITSDEFYQRLKQRNVYVIAGHHFFPGLDEQWEHKNQCIRISYAGSEQTVERGISIIAEEAHKAYHPKN